MCVCVIYVCVYICKCVHVCVCVRVCASQRSTWLQATSSRLLETVSHWVLGLADFARMDSHQAPRVLLSCSGFQSALTRPACTWVLALSLRSSGTWEKHITVGTLPLTPLLRVLIIYPLFFSSKMYRKSQVVFFVWFIILTATLHIVT